MPQSPYDYLFPELPEPELDPRRTALLIIDMQYFDADPEHGWGRRLKEQGVFHLGEPFFKRLHDTVIPNIQTLQHACREHGIEVIFIKIEMQKLDLKDAGRWYRLFGFDCPRGSKEAEILSEIAPLPNEIVIAKTSTSAFSSTSVNQLLRNLGVDTLLVSGVNTDACVELTSRDAADHGYFVTVIGDACACLSGDHKHRATLRRLSVWPVRSTTTAMLVKKLHARPR